MTTFDSWEVGVRPTDDYLMHWGIRGMKHGRNRYQNPDGTWTEEGLERRRQREGFGQSRKERKAQKAVEKAEKKQARIEARTAAIENRRKRNVKNLTDEELQKRIERLKLEKEYKELNKNPLIETGANLLRSHLENKKEQAKLESEKANLQVRKLEAQAKLANAQAAKTSAKNDLIDNIFSGKGKKKAKTDLIKAKTDNQVRGALRKAVSSVISKEGQRFVKGMGSDSRLMKIGRGVKKTVSKVATYNANMVVKMLKSSSKAEEEKTKLKKE